MNPLPLVYWVFAAALVGLAPHWGLGWPWWQSFGAGLIVVPPLFWLTAFVLDRWDVWPEKRGVDLPDAESREEIGPAPACPQCGAGESSMMLYGLPALDAELEQAIAEKRVVLAGCVVYAGAPLWICKSCGAKHGSLALADDTGE